MQLPADKENNTENRRSMGEVGGTENKRPFTQRRWAPLERQHLY